MVCKVIFVSNPTKVEVEVVLCWSIDNSSCIFCNAALLAKSKMAAMGHQNGRRGLESGLPVGFWALRPCLGVSLVVCVGRVREVSWSPGGRSNRNTFFW